MMVNQSNKRFNILIKNVLILFCLLMASFYTASAEALKIAKAPIKLASEDYSAFILRQMTRCIDVPANTISHVPHKLHAELTLAENGTVKDIKFQEELSDSSHAQSLRDSFIRAFKRCAPYRGLSDAEYEQWKKTTITIDLSKIQ